MKTRVVVLIGSVTLFAGVCGSVLFAAGEKARSAAPREVTIVGRIVDLQGYMSGRAASGDSSRVTQQAIRAGVPAALVTEDGLIVIGQGEKGPMRAIMPLAAKEAELKGKLYEKEGLRYIDVVSVGRPKKTGEDEAGEEGEAEPLGDDPDGPPDE